MPKPSLYDSMVKPLYEYAVLSFADGSPALRAAMLMVQQAEELAKRYDESRRQKSRKLRRAGCPVILASTACKSCKLDRCIKN